VNPATRRPERTFAKRQQKPGVFQIPAQSPNFKLTHFLNLSLPC